MVNTPLVAQAGSLPFRSVAHGGAWGTQYRPPAGETATRRDAHS